MCVQKTSEAEALAALGVNNIYISNEVISPFKLKRVVALARELESLGGQLAIAVDSLEGLQRLDIDAVQQAQQMIEFRPMPSALLPAKRPQ